MNRKIIASAVTIIAVMPTPYVAFTSEGGLEKLGGEPSGFTARGIRLRSLSGRELKDIAVSAFKRDCKDKSVVATRNRTKRG